jgi:SAM-dependent methyltransferase
MMDKTKFSGDESDAVRRRYAARADSRTDWRYNFLNPAVWQSVFERQRHTADLLARHAPAALSTLRLVEVGCGEGGNLLEFLRYGMEPSNLQGLELLEDRAAMARQRLPAGVSFHVGNALHAQIAEGSQDIAFQSVVFSSLLDDNFQESLAAAMWRWLKPGGAVLWYDFIYNNPGNRDVRGMPRRRIRELFPQGKIESRRVTLAPPIARRVVRVHPSLYGWFNMMPWLRTHELCWIHKP